MRVADYIFKFLADCGTKHVFLITGGGAMFLNDAVGKEKRINYICNLHEQACAMAAEGYARISGKPGVICVTTGPGGTNALTGVAGAWLDSIPMIIISGQVKFSTTIASCPQLNLRQLGDQELNIVDIVRPITKYAAMVTEAADIAEEISKAWQICQSGRPGPVWLDIPHNVQNAELPDNYPMPAVNLPAPVSPAENDLNAAVEKLSNAARPAIIAGIGVRHGKAEKKLLEWAEKCNIPVLTAISGIDLIPSDHPLFFGRPGILGERPANFIMQNCDCLLTIGTRMNLRQIGFAYETIAREAYRIMVDIDPAELNKPTFKPHLKIACDSGEFLDALMQKLPELPPRLPWLDYCRRVKKDYPVITAEHRNISRYVSSYTLPESVSSLCHGNEIIVTGNGTAYTSTFQTFPIKKGMRMFANIACASMGYGLPAAIGAALAAPERQVICFTGDGSIQMNIQELQTVKNYQLNLKIFVYNNDGYLSIKLTQNAFFNGHLVGSDPSSGIVLPDMEKIANAYGLPFYRLDNPDTVNDLLPEILGAPGAAVIEVMTDPLETLSPKAASKKLPDGSMVSAPLEDMYPFLDREEFRKNMLIKPLPEKF